MPVQLTPEHAGRPILFCDPSCAELYGITWDDRELREELREQLELPEDQAVFPAPQPHMYEWWSPGGGSRREWGDVCARRSILLQAGTAHARGFVLPSGGIFDLLGASK